jgi:hypothetical protein
LEAAKPTQPGASLGECEMHQRDQAFVSYCHTDNKKYLQRLQTHLKPFEKEYSIKYWADTKIKPGEQWNNEIHNALERTAVAILLVSANFAASDFIREVELPYLLKAEQSDRVKILPVYIDSLSSNALPTLSKFQGINDPAKPLSLLVSSQQEKIWAQVVDATKVGLDDFKSKAEAAERAVLEKHKIIKWEKVATLFWLGNDLMWIQDRIDKLERSEHLLHGVEGALKYANDLGFDKNSYPIVQLKLARMLLRQLTGFSPESYASYIEEHYRALRKYIEQVKWYIHQLASLQQTGFDKWRTLSEHSE